MSYPIKGPRRLARESAGKGKVEKETQSVTERPHENGKIFFYSSDRLVDSISVSIITG